MSCEKAAPYLLRVTASGALLAGSVANLVSGEKINPFFYASFYSAAIYTLSNMGEAYKALKAPEVTREQIAELESIRIDTFTSTVVASRSERKGI